MDLKEKEKKLREIANSVFEYPESQEELNYLLRNLNLTKKEVISAYLKYDMDITSYENEIYESLAMRMVLYLHYLLKRSWHQDRQNSILKMVEKANPKSIVDMGFGAPTKYLKEYVLPKKKKIVLVDLYESAFEFSTALFDYLEGDWKKFISFRKIDMNTHEYPGDFDCYIFQDSIEHVQDSGRYLSKIVKQSPENSKFIFSLPIGPLMECHTIFWDSEKEASQWLNGCGLKIIELENVYTNKEVDLFTEQIEEEFYNLVVLCEKKV